MIASWHSALLSILFGAFYVTASAQHVIVTKSTPASEMPGAGQVIHMQAGAIPLQEAFATGAASNTAKMIMGPEVPEITGRGEVIQIQTGASPLPPGSQPAGEGKEILGDGATDRPGGVIELPPTAPKPVMGKPPSPPLQTTPE